MNRKSRSPAAKLSPSAKVAYMGLDCHKKFSRLTGRDSEGRIVCRQRLEHDDLGMMQRQLKTYPPGTPVVLESSFGWGWMSDALAAARLDPHLANCRKIDAWRKARGHAKSNRLDADLLSELWPQQPRWWEVYLAPREVRDQRELLRHRMGLVQIQTAIKNRIHAILHRHGILAPYSDLFGKAGRAFLDQLLLAGDTRLRQSARATLTGDLHLLATLRQELAEVLMLLRRHVAESSQARRWKTLPGIGWILAHTIHAEVGPIDRFADARHLASYSLLTPQAHDSGDEDPTAPPIGRHLGKMGRRTLKWAFLEAAHNAVLKSPRMRAFFDKRTLNGTCHKNRGYVAVAHQLCLIGFACQQHACDYQENPPPRPGTRPDAVAVAKAVQGQPDAAMADPRLKKPRVRP